MALLDRRPRAESHHRAPDSAGNPAQAAHSAGVPCRPVLSPARPRSRADHAHMACSTAWSTASPRTRWRVLRRVSRTQIRSSTALRPLRSSPVLCQARMATPVTAWALLRTPRTPVRHGARTPNEGQPWHSWLADLKPRATTGLQTPDSVANPAQAAHSAGAPWKGTRSASSPAQWHG